jgi:iron only hydrogenase large subunit-like protein
MTSKFSGALQLTDLNDFITPSQACVRPVKIDKADTSNIASIEVNNDTGEYFQVNIDGSRKELKKTKIDLSDCLACSGCVTSAESVLVNQQSVEELLRVLHTSFNYEIKYTEEEKQNLENKMNEDDDVRYKVMIVSISPQSIASVAAYFNCSIAEAERRLHHMFHQFGAYKVFDTTWSRHFSHLELCHEFDSKFSAIAQQRKQQNDTSSEVVPRRAKRAKKDIEIPLLASACPGFVCYAEKTYGDFIIPYIATTKSPQQIMGSIVKQYFVKLIGEQQQQTVNSSDIYHVSVMPCFDKKLEASRDDFQIEDNVKEVDMVLTSSEVINLLKSQFNILDRNEFMNLVPNVDTDLSHISHKGLDSPLFSFSPSDILSYGISDTMESGGYTETLFRFAAKKYFGIELSANQSLEYKSGRNSDFKEVTLQIEENNQKKVLLRMAIANGFRNIQNIVRKLKTGRSEYDFIEVMACPSGCVNGGGQITAPENVAPRDHLQKVKDLYLETLVHINKKNEQTTGTPTMQDSYNLWIKDGVYSANAKQLFHTQYHAREKLNINPLTIQW